MRKLFIILTIFAFIISLVTYLEKSHAAGEKLVIGCVFQISFAGMAKNDRFVMITIRDSNNKMYMFNLFGDNKIHYQKLPHPVIFLTLKDLSDHEPILRSLQDAARDGFSVHFSYYVDTKMLNSITINYGQKDYCWKMLKK